MDPSVDHQMTEIYCFVDEFLKTHPRLATWRRSPHAQPQFSDAEVLTIALLQGVFAVATLKQTYRLVTRNWGSAFPFLPTYQQWMARLHDLGPHVGRVLASTCSQATTAARLYLIDSKPIPLCAPIRHGRVRRLRDEGAYFGKTSKGWFFGFKLHLLRHIDGRVLNIILTPGGITMTATLPQPWSNGWAVASPWATWAIVAPSARPSWPKTPGCCSLRGTVPRSRNFSSVRCAKALKHLSASCGGNLWIECSAVPGAACGIQSN
jgi:DDE family transposase